MKSCWLSNQGSGKGIRESWYIPQLSLFFVMNLPCFYNLERRTRTTTTTTTFPLTFGCASTPLYSGETVSAVSAANMLPQTKHHISLQGLIQE